MQVTPPPNKAALVVEDNPATLYDTIVYIRALNWTVNVAGSVTEAMEYLRQAEYEVIILDWGIPISAKDNTFDRNGGRVLLRRLAKGQCGTMNQQTWFIVVTGQTGELSIQEAITNVNFYGLETKLGVSNIQPKIINLNSLDEASGLVLRAIKKRIQLVQVGALQEPVWVTSSGQSHSFVNLQNAIRERSSFGKEYVEGLQQSATYSQLPLSRFLQLGLDQEK